MIVTAENLAHYLLDHALLERGSVVDGDLTIADASRRNRNFKIIRKRNPGFFVKQANQTDPHAVATLQREATLYWLVKYKPELAELVPVMPRFQAYDPARYILIIDLLSGQSLAQHYVMHGFGSTGMAVALGRALATFHGDVGALLEGAAQQPLFQKAPPWILSVHDSSPNWFINLSAANSQMIEIVRAYPDFLVALNELRSQWSSASLIHGDIKWENCIIDATSLKLVDWELADIGDPLWDAGAVLQSYLTHWIVSLRISPGATPPQMSQLGTATLDAMLPSVRAFWETYAAARGVAKSAERDALHKAIRYAAARMIQSVYEYMATSQHLAQNALYLLQVSLNILKDPDGAARDLLGMRYA